MDSLGFTERGFGDLGFNAHYYFSSWISSFSFDYVAGATVFVEPVMTRICTPGTNNKLYFSSDSETWYEVTPNERNYILFTDIVSGTNNIYAKITFESCRKDLTAIVSQLYFIVHQETSLYTIATQVCVDGLTPVNATWNIDERLQQFAIPYSWLSKMSHRAALGKVAEACGGSAFQDRYGVVRVQSGQFIAGTVQDIGSLRNVTEDEIYTMESPVADVSNSISVTTKPYKAGSSQTVWETTSAQAMVSGEVKVFKVSYSDYDAVIEADATLTGDNAAITSETYYYSGAEIEVTATADTSIALAITGKPLTVVGSVIKTETDGESIRRYGVRSFNVDDNILIQSEEIAELVAESIIDITKDAKRNVEMNWRGDPRLELGDCVTINGQEMVMVTMSHDLAGYYEETVKMRRV